MKIFPLIFVGDICPSRVVDNKPTPKLTCSKLWDRP